MLRENVTNEAKPFLKKLLHLNFVGERSYFILVANKMSYYAVSSKYMTYVYVTRKGLSQKISKSALLSKTTKQYIDLEL
jgi:hypothetical protein